MSLGEYVFFDGMTWTYENRTQRERAAVLLQYTTPDSRVSIPLNWRSPIRWHSSRPPCALVAGSDRRLLNRMITRPVGEDA